MSAAIFSNISGNDYFKKQMRVWHIWQTRGLEIPTKLEDLETLIVNLWTI
jgi:hypothetical protein